jgi:hypothetical protein
MVGLDLMSIFIGVAVAAVVRRWLRRWLWVPIGGALAAIALNGLHDLYSYGDFFFHLPAMSKDAIAFSVWGLIVFVSWGLLRRPDSKVE